MDGPLPELASPPEETTLPRLARAGVSGLAAGEIRFPPSEEGAAALLGTSRAAEALRRKIVTIARSEVHVVLLQGETGTGKDLVARAIHAESRRSARELVVVNCSAVPDGLLEAEFFGHEAGAFTDARRAKAGLLEVADGGTLFLDEVAELGRELQAKLLRLLEDPTSRRLGATRTTRVDVRFIAATNLDLARAAEEGRFRRDLYYRLGVVTVDLPPLRERREDVPVLARHFLGQLAVRFHKPFAGFEEAALERLTSHAWPGNVRELRNAIERVVLLEEGPLVRPEMLLLEPTRAAPAPAPRSGPDLPEGGGIRELELAALVRALERSAGNQSAAARVLGVSRDTVRHWMRRHGVRVAARVIVDGEARSS